MKKVVFAILLGAVVISCSKSDDISPDRKIAGLDDIPWIPGPLDTWIYDTFTKPYNIAVLYKWDQSEVPDLSKTLTPTKEELVVPMLTALKKVWVEPYVAEAGNVFFKTVSPKQIMLFGSPNVNSDGTTTLGVAEGGRKILLYNVNTFNPKTSPDDFIQKLHVVEHEFAHIVTQTVPYARKEYAAITSGYKADWYNSSDAQAREAGFISAYAQADVDEDFAEMVGFMLEKGKTGFDNMINSVSSSTARTALLQKKQMVINYYRNAYGIDFLSLQDRTYKAIVELTTN